MREQTLILAETRAAAALAAGRNLPNAEKFG
jgi:hypothetical protein